jgi:hypothetical protein
MNDLAIISINAQARHAYGVQRTEHRHEHHEHRAPTDESVRLLQEMQDRALASVIGAFKTEGNTLRTAWHVIDDPMRLARRAIVRFTLNGSDYEFTIDLPEHRFSDIREVAIEVHRRVTEELARVLTADLFIEAKAFGPR